jgi:hypothetical protein
MATRLIEWKRSVTRSITAEQGKAETREMIEFKWRRSNAALPRLRRRDIFAENRHLTLTLSPLLADS